MRFVRVMTRFVAGAALAGVVAAGAVLAGGGQARAAAPAAPLGGPTSATLTQVNAAEWTVTVYLETAALCAGKNPAGNKFRLVTGTPDSVTGAATPQYNPAVPHGMLQCGTAAENPVTGVKLTFTPSPALSAVPQTATLVVTPPQALLLAGDSPTEIPLTVRRIVSPWQYVIIPGLCGAGLAALLVLCLMAAGVPPRAEGNAKAGAGGEPEASTEIETAEEFETVVVADSDEEAADSTSVTHEVIAAREVMVVARQVHAAGGARAGGGGAGAGGQDTAPAELVHHGREFWQAPLYAGATWSFSDSWVTSITPLTTLVGAVLTASGAVAGLVPGVDLGRFTLLMTLLGGLAVLAPLLFSALKNQFPAKAPAPPGEVIAAKLWVMAVASCLIAFAVGAETCFVGWVLGYDLVVASQPIRSVALVLAAATASLFLFYSVHAILFLAAEPAGKPKDTAKDSTFMI